MPMEIWRSGIVKDAGPEAMLLLAYMHTSPYVNMIGLYREPLASIAAHCGMTNDAAFRRAVRRACRTGLANYDLAEQYVYTPLTFAYFNVGAVSKRPVWMAATVKPDRRIGAVMKLALDAARCQFSRHFYATHRESCCLPPCPTLESAFVGRFKPLMPMP